jgi:hypothetical protein
VEKSSGGYRSANLLKELHLEGVLRTRLNEDAWPEIAANRLEAKGLDGRIDVVTLDCDENGKDRRQPHHIHTFLISLSLRGIHQLLSFAITPCLLLMQGT